MKKRKPKKKKAKTNKKPVKKWSNTLIINYSIACLEWINCYLKNN